MPEKGLTLVATILHTYSYHLGHFGADLSCIIAYNVYVGMCLGGKPILEQAVGQ